jgi:hypothetical protein
VGQSKTGSGDQSHDYQAVFDVVACLQCVVPEVESLRDMAAKTNQEKQNRAELKKVPPHFAVSKPPRIPRAEDSPTILVVFT